MAKLSISLVHPTCSPFARNAALSFSEAGILSKVITTLGFMDDDQLFEWLPTVLKNKLKQNLSTRIWSITNSGKIVASPWREILRLSLTKWGLNSIIGWGPSGGVDWIYASLDRYVSSKFLYGLSAVYAYEDVAADTFKKSKSLKIKCLYDLPIAFYKTAQKIQKDEAALFPVFSSSLKAINEPRWKIERKEEEIALADHIFCASSFTKMSLLSEGISDDRITVIPYGAPTDYFLPDSKKDNVFRVIFVGRVGPRKGVHYLIDAWQSLRLSNAELLLIGVNEFPDGWLEKYSNSVHYVRSVPHKYLKEYYNSADVLVLSSLVEGFGLVLLEAMACGVPVITTPNSAGPDIVNEGVNGFIVPIRNVKAIEEKIEWCYQNSQELSQMKIEARKTAEYYTWGKYRKILADKVIKLLNNN